ncbi:MAG: hypothetical protein AAF203_05225 [Pseudomonadota bacterium]
MKKTLLFFFSLCISLQGLTKSTGGAETSPDADYSANSTIPVVQVSDYYDLMTAINTYEAERNYYNAFNASVDLVVRIHSDLKIGQLAVTEHARVTRILNEQVTETHWESSYSSASAGFDAVIAGGSYSSESSSSSSWDVTKFLDQNAMQVAEFDAQAKNAQGALDRHLQAYVQTHMAELVLMKVAAQKAFAFATQLGKDQVQTDTMTKLYNVVSNITFIGQYQVTRCVETNFTDRSRRSSSSFQEEASAFFLFISAEGSRSYEHNSGWNQHAHTQTECTSQIVDGAFNPGSSFYFELDRADAQLEAIMRTFYQKRIWTFDEAEDDARYHYLPVFRKKN